ncbi:MAG: PorT family protein [Treponema sp.]|nr:PorT family protein [Treponema sp.]
MKKALVLVAAVALCGQIAFAEKVAELGVKGGLLLNAGTKFINEPDEEYSDYKKMALGGDIGIFGHFGIAEIGSGTISLQPELFFSFGNGVKYEEKVEVFDDTVTFTQKFKYTSLDLALLVGYDIPVGKARITPFVGPKLGIPIGKMKSTFEVDIDGTKETEKTEMATMSTLGVDFGVGFAIPLGSFVLGGDIRYGIDYKLKPSNAIDEGIRRGALGINVTAGYRF